MKGLKFTDGKKKVFILRPNPNFKVDKIMALGGFQMAVRRPFGHEISGEAECSVDRYWRGARYTLPKGWADNFIEQLRENKEWFKGVREIWCMENALVGNGLQMITSWIDGAGSGTYTYPTKIQIGESTQAVARTDNACISAIIAPAGMAEATGVHARIDGTNVKDTWQIAKVASPFDNTGGTTKNVTEACVRNTDVSAKALCRATSTVKQVLVNEQLAVTYNLQILTAAL